MKALIVFLGIILGGSIVMAEQNMMGQSGKVSSEKTEAAGTEGFCESCVKEQLRAFSPANNQANLDFHMQMIFGKSEYEKRKGVKTTY